ncbi:MAG: hypothetical protein ABI672_15730 [Vicinamibacteria bacterium]
MDQATDNKIVSFIWEEIGAYILAIEKKAEGLLDGLLKGGQR